MTHQLHEIWKQQNFNRPSKNRWYVQGEKGVISFDTKKKAQAWVDAITGNYPKYGRAEIQKVFDALVSGVEKYPRGEDYQKEFAVKLIKHNADAFFKKMDELGM